MWRWNACLLVLGSLAIESIASAAPPVGEVCSAIETWVRLDLVYGRIRATPHCPRVEITRESGDLPAGDGHRVEINGCAANLRVLYERCDSGGWLRLTVENREVTLTRESKSPARSLRLHQPQSGPLRLEIRDDSGSHEWTGENLWSLVLGDPAICERHLDDALAQVRSDWRLSERRARLTEELLRVAQVAPTREQIEAAVARLASPSFRERALAERELLAGGPAVLRHLDAIDRRLLNAEQQSRIERIAGTFRSALDADRCERIAAWLAPEPTTWLCLMFEPDEQTRLLAYDALRRHGGAPVEFDPRGDEGQRREQLGRLQGTLR